MRWLKNRYPSCILSELRHEIFQGGLLGYQVEATFSKGTLHNMKRVYTNEASWRPTGKDSSVSRDWLARLWRTEEELNRSRRHRNVSRLRRDNLVFHRLPYSQFIRPFLKRAVENEQVSQATTGVNQIPISQSVAPSTPEEVKLAPLLARANLAITRDIEWANIMFAFEQESRYAIVDASFPQSPVGFIYEQSNVIYRQLLRSRRPFIAYITDAKGNEIFRVRRPFWLINSTIYVEVDGKVIGVVHRRWHLWKRIYDLYLGNKQFAVVENPGFWNWTFTLKDEDDRVLAQIDRDWRGLGFELFTDAGQYVIRFGDADSGARYGMVPTIQELDVARQLNISERAVAVALAISLDNDYFSRRGGWGLPILIAGE